MLPMVSGSSSWIGKSRRSVERSDSEGSDRKGDLHADGYGKWLIMASCWKTFGIATSCCKTFDIVTTRLKTFGIVISCWKTFGTTKFHWKTFGIVIPHWRRLELWHLIERQLGWTSNWKTFGLWQFIESLWDYDISSKDIYDCDVLLKQLWFQHLI